MKGAQGIRGVPGPPGASGSTGFKGPKGEPINCKGGTPGRKGEKVVMTDIISLSLCN